MRRACNVRRFSIADEAAPTNGDVASSILSVRDTAWIWLAERKEMVAVYQVRGGQITAIFTGPAAGAKMVASRALFIERADGIR